MVAKLDELFTQNQEQRELHAKDPIKFLDSESALHAHLHEMQALAAYPDKLNDFIDVGAIESLLGVLQHQNVDVCQLCVTLLCEIIDKEMAESNPEAVKKCMDQLTENSVWVLLLKVCILAETEKEQKGEISQGEEDLLVQKCLTLLDNMRDLAPSVISNKILHSDNVIDYLLENIEREDQSVSISAMSSELVSNLIQSCAEDFRTKFVLTLAGMARLLAVVDKRYANGDKEVLLNVFDTLAALLVGNKEHA